mgnify:CR=1 FL=1
MMLRKPVNTKRDQFGKGGSCVGWDLGVTILLSNGKGGLDRGEVGKGNVSCYELTKDHTKAVEIN